MKYDAYLFDLDGTIYLGQHAIDGAVDTVNKLLERNKRVLFLTNKTIDSRENYVKKLNGLGIPAKLGQIISPTLVTLDLLRTRHRGEKVYVIGEPIFKAELERAGIAFAAKPEETDLIVVSWDRNFHYEQLNYAYQAIRCGAKVLATNPDRTCPVPGGDLPDCAGMIGAIEGATGLRIDYIAGKPSKYMADVALSIVNVPAECCLMVGDRLETDIKLGQHSGIRTALVLTGVSRPEDVESASHKPDYILDSVNDLLVHC